MVTLGRAIDTNTRDQLAICQAQLTSLFLNPNELI